MSSSISTSITEQKTPAFSSSIIPSNPTEVSVEKPDTQADQVLQKLAEALRPAHFQEGQIAVRPSLPNFVGRQNILDHLSHSLSNQPDLHQSQIVRVISGPAGFGKTELAIHFANLNKERFSLIRLFHCGSEELFEQEMRDFGKLLGLSVENEPKERVLALIYQRLSHTTEDKPYCLIYDNVKESLPLPGQGGFCLLTTSDPNIHLDLQQLIEISPFSPEETQALYQQLYHKPLSLEHAHTLTQKLGGSPLLLNLALSELRYIRIEQYLECLHQSAERDPQLLKTVILNIRRRLEENDALAFRFFHFCTHLNPDHISLALLQDWLQSQHIEEIVQVGQGVVHSLTDCSLIQYDPASQTFSLHRLIQMIFQESHTQASYNQALRLTLQHAKQFKQREIATWKKGKEGVVQLPSLQTAPFWEHVSPKEKITLLSQAGEYLLRVQGEAKKAYHYFEMALHLSLGQEDRLLQANSYHSFGLTLQLLGQYEKALKCYRKALDIRLEVLGKRHVDDAESYYMIGTVFTIQKKHEEALGCYHQALEIQREVLGNNHPDLYKIYNNIGISFLKLNKLKEALENFQQALSTQVNVLEEDYIALYTINCNIGAILDQLGRYDEAMKHKKQAVEIQRKTLGDNHPDVAVTYNTIGATYQFSEKYEEALASFEQARVIQVNALGEDHPNLALTYLNLGTICDTLKRFEDAMQYKQRALAIQAEALGTDHLDVAEIHQSIGKTFNRLKKPGEALKSYQRAIEIQAHALGTDHPDLSVSYHNIGLTFVTLGEYEKGLEHLKQALFILCRSLNESPPNHLQIFLQSILFCLQRDTDLWKSSVIEEITGVLNETLGESHSLTLQFEQAKKQALGGGYAV